MPSIRICRARRAALCSALCLATSAIAAPPLRLHVPSPDWRDQVLYFALTDRFDDGDARNNDQGAGVFDPSRRNRYSGGDLAGLLRRLDYIRGLGATGLWLTPPVANQWLDPWGDYTGYHGYWARDFSRVDEHVGTLADYRRLSDGLHRRDMVLVQDIVVNHTGNFFRWRGGWDAADPARHFERNTAALPTAAPTQAPFDRNDAAKRADRAAGIYHWTPDIADYTQRGQELDWQMSGLDDLNTENPAVRRALRASYGHWISAVGVDAFRVDTAFYVPPDYFVDFLHARDRSAPGIAEVARRTGRRDFHVFGEGFAIDRPYDDTQARKIDAYMTGTGPALKGQPVLPGMLNFPLYGALNDAFARGRPPAELAHRITQTMRLHARPHRMPNFIDNHDVDRFLAGGSVAGLRQALLAMLTLPGIPVIYYGTEQGFTQQRASMFAAGWGSGGRDHFDTKAPLYRDIAAMTTLRRTHRLFSRGVPTVLQANAAQAGALAWRMDYSGDYSADDSPDDSPGPKARGRGQTGQAGRGLVVVNTADAPTLLAALDTGLPAGTRLKGLYALDGAAPDLVVGDGGRITLPLAARAGFVWRVGAGAAAGPVVGGAAGHPDRTTTLSHPASAAPVIDPLPALGRVGGDFDISGSAPAGSGPLRIVVDGDLARAQTVQPDAAGRWRARIDTAAMIDPAVPHQVTAWAESAVSPALAPAPAASAASSPAASPQVFHVDRPWQLVADIEDPAGDDRGPTGRYVYPTDASWGDNRQMDLRRVRVSTAGGALKLELTTHRITTSWSPANGFDHVAFTVFIELPGADGGTTVMPLQDGLLPEGMRWHRRLRAHGWSNALFSAAGASAGLEGTPATPAATLGVDRTTDTVSFVLPALALGRPATLSGARIYVTTWDYDGGYRALAAQPGGHSMGGDAAGGAKVMDASAVIRLP